MILVVNMASLTELMLVMWLKPNCEIVWPQTSWKSSMFDIQHYFISCYWKYNTCAECLMLRKCFWRKVVMRVACYEVMLFAAEVRCMRFYNFPHFSWLFHDFDPLCCCLALNWSFVQQCAWSLMLYKVINGVYDGQAYLFYIDLIAKLNAR